MREKNLMTQLDDPTGYLNSMEAARKYGVFTGTGNSHHSTLMEHLMLRYCVRNNIKLVSNISWMSSSNTNFHFHVDHIAAAMKEFFKEQDYTRKGRVVVPDVYDGVQTNGYGKPYALANGKPYAFVLKDTEDGHFWDLWDPRPAEEKRRRRARKTA